MGSQLSARRRRELEEVERLRSTLRFSDDRKRRTRNEEILTGNAYSLLTERMRKLEGRYVRQPGAWTCKLRTSDVDRRRMDLVRHLFQKYRVPSFLEKVWTHPTKRIDPYTDWYLCVAQGRSLYREVAKGTLTKRECHVYLAAPDWTDPVSALWWTRAKCMGASESAARAIASSRMVDEDLGSDFWVSAVRFFIVNPTTAQEISELLDWIRAERYQQPNFSLSGRTLEAVRKKCRQWHKARQRMRQYGAMNWPGIPIPDWTWSTGSVEEQNLMEWTCKQILDGKTLSAEGSAMRHCVGSYANACASGKSAIFSLSLSRPFHAVHQKRCITIEVRAIDRTVVQARGLANRHPTSFETTVLVRWANQVGVEYDSRKYW
jgi:hypothetical protein